MFQRSPAVDVLHTRPALIAGGAVLGLSFPPFPFPFLAFAALVPLLLRWQTATSRRGILWDAFLTFLTTFAVAFSWPLLHVFPHTAASSLYGILLLPIFLALPFAISVWVRWKVGRAAGLVCLIAFYLVVELGLSRGPLAFPWPLLGHTLSEALILNQYADLTGVSGLTLLVLLGNSLLFLSLTEETVRWRLRLALSALSLLVALLSYGTWRLGRIPQGTDVLKVGLIQPAIGPAAWSNVHDTSRLDTLQALSQALLAPDSTADLMIWPETALPLGIASRSRVQRLASDTRVPILTGAVVHAGTSAYYNAAFLFSPARPEQRYDKRYLVPFAERVPFVEKWPALQRLAIPAGGVAGYIPGREQSLLEIGMGRFGVLICLESLFGNYARRYTKEGADFLVVLTQDGWWGRSLGYRQHLAFNRLRAIESRRAVLQASVTGTSALILPDGSIAFQTRWMERAARAVDVPLLGGTTFYTRHGDWLGYSACAIAALLIFAAAIVAAKQTAARRRPSAVKPDLQPVT